LFFQKAFKTLCQRFIDSLAKLLEPGAKIIGIKTGILQENAFRILQIPGPTRKDFVNDTVLNGRKMNVRDPHPHGLSPANRLNFTMNA
jgi:hypothetical protein